MARRLSWLRWLLAPALVALGAPVAIYGVGSAPAQAASLPKCPLQALQKAKGTVNITVWNSMPRNNQVTLQQLTNRFNSSQHKVHVTLVQQDSYDATWAKYQAGLSNGQLPNVAQLQDINLAGAVQSRSILPVQACINAAHYSTSDYLPRVLNYWKTDGIEQGMPFAVSAPVLYYNKAAFTKAGLNPDQPPTTVPEMITDAEKLKASGDQGMGLKLDPWHLETWLASANKLFVNHSNGRKGTASASVFDNAVGLQIFSELNDLVNTTHAAVTNPSTGPSEYDNLLGIGSGKYGMSIDTSAALGTILVLLKSGQYAGTQLGVGPFPALSAKYHGGIEPGGSALYIVKKGSTPAQQAASWSYITYMDSAASQATWAVGTGYIPIRKSSVETPTIKQAWKTTPQYMVAYQELLGGANTPATAGAVIGAFPDVRTAELNAEQSMFQQKVSPKNALRSAARNIDSVIQQYNQRLGS